MSKPYSTLRLNIKTIRSFLTSYFTVNWNRSKKPSKSQPILTAEFVVDTILLERKRDDLPVTLHLQVPEPIFKRLLRNSANYMWPTRTIGSFNATLVEQMDGQLQLTVLGTETPPCGTTTTPDSSPPVS